MDTQPAIAINDSSTISGKLDYLLQRIDALHSTLATMDIRLQKVEMLTNLCYEKLYQTPDSFAHPPGQLSTLLASPLYFDPTV